MGAACQTIKRAHSQGVCGDAGAARAGRRGQRTESAGIPGAVCLMAPLTEAQVPIRQLELFASAMESSLVSAHNLVIAAMAESPTEQEASQEPPGVIDKLKARVAELESTKVPPLVPPSEKRKRKQEVLEPSDYEYIQSVKQLQAQYKTFAEADRWGALRSKQMLPGFLLELLDDLKIECSADDAAAFRLIDVKSVAKSMPASYDSNDVFADNTKAVGFLRRSLPPTNERRKWKQHYLDGYMAFLRVMGEPFVARNFDR